MKRFFLPLIFLSFFSYYTHSQQLQLDGIGNNFSKNEWFKMTGGFSASSVYYNSNTPNNRDPLDYFLNGNINFNLFNLINTPFSFNFTNSGSNYTYPTLPNRFSLHPSYKWITLHIGDISMSFSPYTLNGHQFTGIGLDLTPGKLKTSIMYGRLQRSVEYNPENPIVQAAYQRMGCGVKVRYDDNNFYIGSSAFVAKDDVKSLMWQPDSLGIRPQQNLAMNIEAGVKLAKNLRLTGEYAVSLLNKDIRDSVSSVLFYKAFKLGIDYQFLKNTIGFSYERVDPDYQTLGAYYFNNDYENITANYSTLLFKDKLNFSSNIGIQKDDINNQKESQTSRFVGSANITYAPTQKLNINVSYSDFQTHQNVKSQFDYINQYSPTQNLDTLNFTQLSQNATVSVFYQFKQTDTQIQSLNTNLNYQVASDNSGNPNNSNGSSDFINASLSHNIQFTPQHTNINSSVNITSDNITSTNFLMFGPSFSISSKFFDKKFTTGFSSSYNVSYNENIYQGYVLNLRLNVGYLFLKHHNLTLNGISQYQDKMTGKNIYNFNSTLAYSYNF